MTTADWKQIEEMGMSREQFTTQAMNYNKSSQSILDRQAQNEIQSIVDLATSLRDNTASRMLAST
jgi:hypothetical protein